MKNNNHSSFTIYSKIVLQRKLQSISQVIPENVYMNIVLNKHLFDWAKTIIYNPDISFTIFINQYAVYVAILP